MRPTASDIRKLVSYDPETGQFHWLIKMRGRTHGGGPRKIGSLAGGPTGNGGWHLTLLKRHYPAAVIAFVMMTDRWPIGEIDHRDRNRANNRWSNLREATKTQNHANRGNFPHSSAYKGVSYCKQTGRWRASIKKDYKLIALGRHPTPELVHAAYVKAAQELFGEFARTN